MDVLSLVLESVPKAVIYGCVILTVGACVACGLFRLRVAAVPGSQVNVDFEPALSRLIVRAALVLLAALAFRAWGHTAVAFGLIESFSWENLRTIAWESQWGQGWQAQMAGALVMVVVAQLLRDWPGQGWPAAAVVATALCYLLPRLGHAEGEPLRVLLHGSHVLGAGIWVGTLGAVVFASNRPADLDGEATGLRTELLSRFSPVAFTGASLLGLTGLIAVWIYVGSLDRLVTTAYGRLLMLKLFLVSDVATLGFLNFQRLRTRDGRESFERRSALVILEVVLAIAVVLVTAILTETEHP